MTGKGLICGCVVLSATCLALSVAAGLDAKADHGRLDADARSGFPDAGVDLMSADGLYPSPIDAGSTMIQDAAGDAVIHESDAARAADSISRPTDSADTNRTGAPPTPVPPIGIKRIEGGTRWPFVIWGTQIFERSPLSRSGSGFPLTSTGIW